MSAHRTLNDLFRAFDTVGPGRFNDPGASGTITFTMWGQICSVVTATAEARTLAQATKPGILATVVLDTDVGDLTLTVTGGYNADADTSITYADAGDFVTFMSVKVGTSYYWRVLAHEGTNVAVEDYVVDQLTAATATIQEIAKPAAVTAEHGAGAVGTGLAPATYRYTRDGVIITEIHVDLTGLQCKGTAAADAIGLTGAAYIGRYVTATCGIVFKVEVICIELPGEGTATITADIDLAADDEGDIAYDGAVDGGVIVNTASLVEGEVATSDVPAMTANDYLYLVEGDTAATTGIYDAGQYIIRLHGHALLA